MSEHENNNIHAVMNQIFDEIKLMFQKLYREDFPSEKGKEILGVDLVMLDSDIMGLASVYIGNRGDLNNDEKTMLKKCVFDLSKILDDLALHEKKYFTDLHKIALSILYNTAQKSF